MCGIAGIVSLGDGLPPPELDQLSGMAGALGIAARTSSGSIVTGARAWVTRGSRSSISSTGQQPLSNETRHALDRRSTARSSITSSCGTSSRASATDSGRAAIPKSSSTPSSSGAKRRSAASMGSGPWRCGTPLAPTLVLARDPFGVRPLYVAEHAGRLYFASEVKAIFAADPSIPRRFDPVGIDQVFTFWTSDRAAYGVRGHRRGRARDRSASIGRGHRPALAVLGSGLSSTADARLFRRHARGRGDGCARRARERDQPPDAARGRAGRQLSVGRARQLAGRGPRAARQGVEVLDVLACASRTPSTTRRSTSARWSSILAAITTRCWSRAATSRGFSRRHLAHRTAGAAHRPGAAVPAVAARAQAGIKVVLTGEGADEMFAGYDLFREAKVRRFWARQPAIRAASAAARAAVSVPRAIAGGAARDVAAVLRPGARAGGDAGLRPRAALARHGRVEAPLLARDVRRAGRPRTRSATLLAAPACATSRAGARWRRISTSKSIRCCPATCCPRRAIAC